MGYRAEPQCPQPSEWNTRQAARQHVVAARSLTAGAMLTREDLTTTRSGGGQPATALWGLVGKVASKGYDAGEVILQ